MKKHKGFHPVGFDPAGCKLCADFCISTVIRNVHARIPYYGYRRMTDHLRCYWDRPKGLQIRKAQVRRLMKLMALMGRST